LLTSVDEVPLRLPFLTACVKETLRLYPPVPFIGRTSTQAAVVGRGTVLVPAGATLCWSPWFLGRDPAHWQAPADAFRPTRWDPRFHGRRPDRTPPPGSTSDGGSTDGGSASDGGSTDGEWQDFFSPTTGQPRPPCAWLPFGAGPRGCLGTRLGLNEAVVAAARLLYEFEFDFHRSGARQSWSRGATNRGVPGWLTALGLGGSGDLGFRYDLTLNLEGTCWADVRARQQ
jgi:cytochrome P450